MNDLVEIIKYFDSESHFLRREHVKINTYPHHLQRTCSIALFGHDYVNKLRKTCTFILSGPDFDFTFINE